MSELLCPGAALAEETRWVRVWLVAPSIAGELHLASAGQGRDEVSGENSV